VPCAAQSDNETPPRTGTADLKYSFNQHHTSRDHQFVGAIFVNAILED
jgi:hypothetical protein